MWGFKPFKPDDPNPNHDPKLPEGVATPCNDQERIWNARAAEYWNIGANRSSKTHFSMAHACALAAGEQPVWSAIFKPPVKIWICSPTWDSNAIGVILSKLRTLARKKDLKDGDFDKAWNMGQGILTWANGSTMQFKTYSQPTATWGGQDLHAIYADEHMPIDKYREAKRGLVDHHGFLMTSMTPELGSIMWERRHILENAEDPDILISKFSIYGNPTLSPEGIKELERACKTDAEKRLKLYGDFVVLSGLVYPMWDRIVHIYNDFQIPEDWYHVFCGDFHLRKEAALLWAAWSPEGELYVYRACKVFKTPPELRVHIRNLSAGEPISVLLGDESESDEGENVYGQHSVISQLNDGPDGLNIQRVGKPKGSFDASIMKVRGLLTCDAISKKPRLRVAKSCQGVVDEFEEFQFIPETKADELSFRDRVRKVFDDYMADVRYLALNTCPQSCGHGVPVTEPQIVLAHKPRNRMTGIC